MIIDRQCYRGGAIDCGKLLILLATPYHMPYKMKCWREYYLAKFKRKHFGRINIGDFDKIISYMCLNLQLGVILMCTYCLSHVVDMEAKAPL